MEHLPIDNENLFSEYEPDDNLLPVIVNVFSLHEIGDVLGKHANDTLQTIDQCSSPPDPIPAVETDVDDTSAKTTEETFSTSHAADKNFSCTYCWRKFDRKSWSGTQVGRGHTCKHCDYSCSEQRRIDQHLHKHTGEKLFTTLSHSYW